MGLVVEDELRNEMSAVFIVFVAFSGNSPVTSRCILAGRGEET